MNQCQSVELIAEDYSYKLNGLLNNIQLTVEGKG